MRTEQNSSPNTVGEQLSAVPMSLAYHLESTDIQFFTLGDQQKYEKHQSVLTLNFIIKPFITNNTYMTHICVSIKFIDQVVILNNRFKCSENAIYVQFVRNHSQVDIGAGPRPCFKEATRLRMTALKFDHSSFSITFFT